MLQETLDLLQQLATIPQQIQMLGNKVDGWGSANLLFTLFVVVLAFAAAHRAHKARTAAEEATREIRGLKDALLAQALTGVARLRPHDGTDT